MIMQCLISSKCEERKKIALSVSITVQQNLKVMYLPKEILPEAGIEHATSKEICPKFLREKCITGCNQYHNAVENQKSLLLYIPPGRRSTQTRPAHDSNLSSFPFL